MHAIDSVSQEEVSTQVIPFGRLHELRSIDPKAQVWVEHGTVFVGIQYEVGRLILGYGDDFKTALTNAIAKHNG